MPTSCMGNVMMIPKPSTPRDPKYLDWIRTLGCAACGELRDIHAHHTKSGGTAIKGSDYSCIPLCARCHYEVHQHTGKGGYFQPEILEQLIESLQHQYNTQIKGE